jgi:hypothetical protein
LHAKSVFGYNKNELTSYMFLIQKNALMKWQSYNPEWLVVLAEEQLSDFEWLPAAFACCTRCLVESKAFIYFVSPENPNQPGAEWQFERNLQLNSPQHGQIIIDVLTNQRIGGIEFLRYASKVRK